MEQTYILSSIAKKHLTIPSLKRESDLCTDLYRDVCTVKMLQRFSFSELYAEIFVDSWPVSNSLISGEFSIPVGLFTVPYLVEARSSFKFSSTFTHKWRWPISPKQVITVNLCSYSSLVRRSRVRFRSNSPRNESSYGARMGNHLLNTHTTPVSSSDTCWSDTAHPERSRDLPRGWIQLTTE